MSTRMAVGRWPGAVGAAGLGMAASALLQTMLATATPVIVTDLGQPAMYGWVTGAYLVCSVLLLALSAPVADRVGPRPAYVAGIGCYLLGTLVVAGAPSMWVLVAGRAVQGCGAGILVPAALAVVGLLPAAQRGRVFGVLGLVQVVANVTGPLAGGWFAAGPGWRWGVGAVAPLAAAGLVMAALSMPTVEQRPTRWWVVRASDVFPPRNVRPAGWLLTETLLAGGVTLAVLTFGPWALAAAHHQDPRAVGAWMLPMAVASAIGSLAGGAMSQRRAALPIGWVVTLAGLLAGFLDHPWATSLACAGVGLGCAMVLPVVLTRVQTAAPPDRLAGASALVQLARHAGSALLVPVLGACTALITSAQRAGIALLSCLLACAVTGLALSWKEP